jgi:TonB family protein
VALLDSLRKYLLLILVSPSLTSSANAAFCDGHISRSDVVAEKVPGDVMLTKLSRTVLPEYPPDARATAMEGTVVVRVRIDPEGCPVGAAILSGPAALSGAVPSAIFQWRFVPTVTHGQGTWVDTTLSFVFSLNGKAATSLPTRHTLIRLQNGRTIMADSAREVDGKVEYSHGDSTYVIPKKLVRDVKQPGAEPTPAFQALPANALLVTPSSASPAPPSLEGDWPPYESTRNIRLACIPEPFDPEAANPRLGPRSCAVWKADMGADYEALVDGGIQLKRDICSTAPPRNGPKPDLRTQIEQLHQQEKLAGIRGELIRRQSSIRFDRLRSTRIIIDYNRLLGRCPN